MNPHHNSNQNPPIASAVPQVNPAINQQMCNGNVGGFVPNNMPIAAPPSCFMNFPNQPFPMQNSPQFPNGFNPHQNFSPFPVNQFNPSQQQGQFFAPNSMNPAAFNQNVGGQALLQNTIQNIYQLLQLQNPNNAQRPPANFPMFQNQIPNVVSHQNPGFLQNQQFVMPNSNGPVQHVNQGQPNMGPQVQGNPFLPNSVQTHQPQNLVATLPNFQNQINQGVGPQNQNFPTNQLFGMPNLNGPVQHVNQGQHRMMDVNASRQVVNTGQTQNPGPTKTNIENNHGNVSMNANGRWTDSQNKNFTGHKRNDASHKGFKSQFNHAKNVKEKFGGYNGNMNKGEDSSARISTNFQKKIPLLNYTDQEIKQWREARKKNYPTSVAAEKESQKEQKLSDVANQEAMLRRQQLKEILAKQAELGCEVAEIPPSYLIDQDKQNPRDKYKNKKHEKERYKKEKKFNKKRGMKFKDNRMSKRTRTGDQDSLNRPHEPKKRDPSLLEKLLSRDIKRDKNHILQVLRFMTVNSFFNGEIDNNNNNNNNKSLNFPSVVVRETNSEELTSKGSQKIEELTFKGGQKVEKEEEEGEITD